MEAKETNEEKEEKYENQEREEKGERPVGLPVSDDSSQLPVKFLPSGVCGDGTSQHCQAASDFPLRFLEKAVHRTAKLPLLRQNQNSKHTQH